MEIQDYLQFFAALVFVLCLMGGLAFVLKRLGIGQAQALSGNDRQLKVLEVLPLDPRRKLLRIENGGEECLILLGASSETVISRHKNTKEEGQS